MSRTRRWSGMLGFALLGYAVSGLWDPFTGGMIAGGGIMVASLTFGVTD